MGKSLIFQHFPNTFPNPALSNHSEVKEYIATGKKVCAVATILTLLFIAAFTLYTVHIGGLITDASFAFLSTGCSLYILTLAILYVSISDFKKAKKEQLDEQQKKIPSLRDCLLKVIRDKKENTQSIVECLNALKLSEKKEIIEYLIENANQEFWTIAFEKKLLINLDVETLVYVIKAYSLSPRATKEKINEAIAESGHSKDAILDYLRNGEKNPVIKDLLGISTTSGQKMVLAPMSVSNSRPIAPTSESEQPIAIPDEDVATMLNSDPRKALEKLHQPSVEGNEREKIIADLGKSQFKALVNELDVEAYPETYIYIIQNHFSKIVDANVKKAKHWLHSDSFSIEDRMNIIDGLSDLDFIALIENLNYKTYTPLCDEILKKNFSKLIDRKLFSQAVEWLYSSKLPKSDLKEIMVNLSADHYNVFIENVFGYYSKHPYINLAVFFDKDKFILLPPRNDKPFWREFILGFISPFFDSLPKTIEKKCIGLHNEFYNFFFSSVEPSVPEYNFPKKWAGWYRDNAKEIDKEMGGRFFKNRSKAEAICKHLKVPPGAFRTALSAHLIEILNQNSFF